MTFPILIYSNHFFIKIEDLSEPIEVEIVRFLFYVFLESVL